MYVTSKISVDLTRPNIGTVVNAIQGDGDVRRVRILLLADGKPWEPPEGVETAVSYLQPTMHKGLYNLLEDGSPAVSVTGNAAEVILAPQMLTQHGTVRAALMFNDPGLNRLTSFPFTIYVAKNPAIIDQQAEDYIRLQWLEDKLEEYWGPSREQIDAAVGDADAAAAAANQAAGVASSSAERADTSAGNASTAADAANQAAQSANAAAAAATAAAEEVAGTDVSQLKQDFAGLNRQVTNAVYWPVFTQGGYYIGNGGFVSDANWGYTPLFEVEPNTTYFLNTPSTQYYNLYDENKTVIPTESGGLQFTTTAQTKYARVSVHSARQSLCVISKGALYFNTFERIDSNISELETFHNLLGNARIQYINRDALQTGKYWWGTGGTSSAEGYQAVLIKDMPKGEYHINAMSAQMTYMVNKEDGSTKKASSHGYADVGGNEAVIDVPFDFDLYLTVYQVANPMWANGKLPDEYVYGAFNINAADSFVKEIARDIPRKYYVGASREYTTLKSAVEEATKYMDSVIFLDAETFDLTAEFGSEYLESYSKEFACGLFLKNRVHIIGAEGSRIVFDYQGANRYIHQWFSPFNSAEYGFTLENVRIESKNCRYAVHDERAWASDVYHNVYKRCTFIHQSDGTDWATGIAIGGGLGHHGDVLIEDGYFHGGGAYDISYHNSTIQNVETKSKVVVRGAYLNGTTLCANYGTSTETSEMIVTGCSLGSVPQLERVISSDRADNMKLTAWNNEVRN